MKLKVKCVARDSCHTTIIKEAVINDSKLNDANLREVLNNDTECMFLHLLRLNTVSRFQNLKSM